MNYKIVAFKYEIPEINDYKGNEFLELELDALEVECNKLLTKYPTKRNIILQEAQIAKDKIINLYFEKLDSISQKTTKIQTLKTEATEKENKLQYFKSELNTTNERLASLQADLNKIPAYQTRIKQIEAKKNLLNKLEVFCSNYPSLIKQYLKYTYTINYKDRKKDTLAIISKTIKSFYKQESLTISAPLLAQYSKEAFFELLDSKGKIVSDSTLVNVLSNSEELDFIWMAILYIERYPQLKIENEDIDLWTLMKPTHEWPEHLADRAGTLYDLLLTKDYINESINKAKISDKDADEITNALNGKLLLELPLLLRLNIQLLINNLITLFQKEASTERFQMQKLSKLILAAKRHGIDTDTDLFLAAEESNKYTIITLKTYYDTLIKILTKYSEIIAKQTSSRYENNIIPYLERISALVKACDVEQKELESILEANKETIKYKNELINQTSALTKYIQSITVELKQDELSYKTLEDSLSSEINNYDEIYPKADLIRNSIESKISNDKIYIDETTPISKEPDTPPMFGIDILTIKVWQELKEETIYNSKNKIGVKLNFMFSKDVLEDIHGNLINKFFVAMKKGLVGAIDEDGIKYMKERKPNNYEIKVKNKDWRIFGHIVLVENKEVIMFDSFETH